MTAQFRGESIEWWSEVIEAEITGPLVKKSSKSNVCICSHIHTSSSAVANEPAPPAVSRQTAKF